MYSLIAHFQSPAMDLAFFEQFFRRERIGLYLVANSQPLGPGLWAGYPSLLAKLKPGTPAKYYLWVGVNGAEEAQLFKVALGISDEENLRRLSETGFILGEPEDAAADPQMDMADADTVQRLKRTSAQKPPSSGGN